MDTGCAIGADAAAELDAAPTEMLCEIGEFGGGGCAVFLGGPFGSPALDELLVASEHFVGIDRGVAHGGIEVLVSEQLGRDVDGQAVVDRVGGEKTSEVVRRICAASPARSTAWPRYSRSVPELKVRGRPASRYETGKASAGSRSVRARRGS